MPRLTAHVDEPVKEAWAEMAKVRGVSESALLSALVATAVNQLGDLDLSGYTNRERGGRGTKIHIRLRPAEERAVMEAAKADGLPSRQAWIIALIRGRLLNLPTPSPAELAELRQSNWELAAIGHNLNQVAHAVNVDYRQHAGEVSETLKQLHAVIVREKEAVGALVQNTLRRWVRRARED